MTFTEVVFELADPRQPLSRLTRAPFKGHAVHRIVESGELTRRHRAHVAYHGSADGVNELVRELRGVRPEPQVEVLHQAQDEVSLLLEAPSDASDSAGLGAIVPALAQHGLHALIDPIVAVEGKLRVRVVIPRHVEVQEMLRALQDVQRAVGFAEFRTQRIAPLDPSAHVECARRSLPAEQEALLALAASMGYYETPKVVTLEEISRAVGLSISPVHKRLKAAEETIVGQHVARAPVETPRRRSRASATRAEPTSPWEIQLRVRGDIGPASARAQSPGARASQQIVSADGARGQVSYLVVAAPEEAHDKLVASIADRPEVVGSTLISRTPTHAALRLHTRDRGAYAMSWWCDTWGADAALRSVVYDGGEAHVRAILTRPVGWEKVQQRLQECARAGGFTEWDVSSVRTLSNGSPPPTWPEPLTQRQLEVLRVAHALGYYRTPRECTLESVAGTLGVSANAIHKNLVLAESKLIAAYLAGGL